MRRVAGGEPVKMAPSAPFTATADGAFDQPRAVASAHGTRTQSAAEMPGSLNFTAPPAEPGDATFPAKDSSPVLSDRVIYLTSTDVGEGDTRGTANVPAMLMQSLLLLTKNGAQFTGRARYHFPERMRAAVEPPHGSRWLAKDRIGGHLLQLARQFG